MLSLTLLFLLAPLVNAAAPGVGGVGKLPALGWNSWNAYNCDVSQKKMLDAANFMISTGLKDAGYEYVNIDDCWSLPDRDNTTGRLLPDLSKFPDGINGTAKKVHDLGFKLGIYSSAGTKTCAGYPASLEHEEIDAQTWADWGVDYLKYDNCNVPPEWQDTCLFCVVDEDNHMDFTPGPNGTCPQEVADWCPPGYDWRESKTYERFQRMAKAIEKAGRPMLYSLCEWGTAGVQEWGADFSQSWRSTGDIFANWDRIKEILNENSFYLSNLTFYAHSDPDMLEVGNLPSSPTSEAETRSHFALWAAMKSPLLIGTDLSKLSSHDLELLKNNYLLAFNQDDEYGRPAQPYRWGTNPDWTFDKERPAEYWSGGSKGGTMVLVLNTDEGAANKTVDFEEVPELDEGKRYTVREVWAGKIIGCVGGNMTVEVGAHDTAVFLFEGECSSKTVLDGVYLPMIV